MQDIKLRYRYDKHNIHLYMHSVWGRFGSFCDMSRDTGWEMFGARSGSVLGDVWERFVTGLGHSWDRRVGEGSSGILPASFL